ncbi:pentatricopeptide repeat-containing protein At4g33170 [Phoenix dactylifera]|uniref:Pentatricopeptide repeat-containing protein At4g33170 n=1 Tax=Phoenix dactylifera TaxID=42345 RepID=A0A8B7D1U0_PHODC|nr:pentatricopeptide repeat-containing protein At4g33170 [Phoenix dactylifera]
MPQCPLLLPRSSRPPLTIPRALLCRLYTSNLSPDQEHEVEQYAHLLHRCAQTSNLELGTAIHARLLKRTLLASSLFLQNHLLNMYFKSTRDPFLPLRLFDEMPQRNIVSWSAAIAGLVQCNHPRRALSLFHQMRQADMRPNEFTLVSTLNASSLSGRPGHARQIYAQVIRLGFESNVFLANAFLTALIRNGRLPEAKEMFENCRDKDVVSWNSMIAGYLQFSYSEVWGFWCRMIEEGVNPDEFSFSSVLTGLAATSSLRLGVQVHAQLVKYGVGDDACVGNSLVDMYLKNRDLVGGFKAFNDMPERDVVAWTHMAAGCLHCGEPGKALEITYQMKLAGIKPNKFTLSTTFTACSSLASLEEGKKGHGFRIKLGVEIDECVDNALIDMYARCGSMDCAWGVFRSMKERSVITWTTMIMGFAQNGLAREALEVFDQMILEHVEPNYITFICALYACSQGGFIGEGWKYFDSMTCDHNIDPGEDHYACMVDLLGKAGKIAEAEALIMSMPFRPGVLVWQTLLGACRLHGDVETGKRAAEQALALEKDPSTYVLLSNMFANTDNWDGVGRIRELMEDREVKKVPGTSWIETAYGSNYPILSQYGART